MTDDIEVCRLCPEDKPESGTWICCDVCETWYHVRCLKMSPEEFEVIDSYHCADCAPKAGPSTLLRKSSRKPGKINYADLVNGIVSHQSRWRVLLESHQFLPDKFERVEGKDVTMDWMRATGFKTPIIVKEEKKNRDTIKEETNDVEAKGTTGALSSILSNANDATGLGMRMPPKTLTVDNVRDAVGADTAVEVIDVATQSELADWNMGAWADYFKTEPKERTYNVISLEISGTPLADQVQRPRVVRELDWIENFWPRELRAKEFPKVQLYCLMSVKDSFTDFHIDFAGSSVFYHILSGAKTFYFVEPTSTHLRKYAKWSSSADQSTTFFGDEVAGKCYKVELQQGDTMLIPAGWIHAVYTPASSVVIGGNFIHSLHIPMQYRVADIEVETNVSPKFRFPFFEKLNWFVALGCMERGQELKGLLALAVHLYCRQRSLKRDPHLTKEERHMIRASIPPEASSFSNGGSLGLLRQLSLSTCSVLETRQEPVEMQLRLPSEDEERKKAKAFLLTDTSSKGPTKASAAAPKIKLRIKLNSTPSSTNSGDEESSSTLGDGEQRVPTLTGSTDCTTTMAAISVPPVSKSASSSAAKLKFKIPILSAPGSTNVNSKTVSRRSQKIENTVDEDDIFGGSDLDELEPSTDDEEWTDFQNQIDEGFGEGRDDDEDLDDGEMLDSSDSEYDEDRTSKKIRPRKSGGNNSSNNSSIITNNNKNNNSNGNGILSTVKAGSYIPIAPKDIIASKPRMKRSSTETVFFGDVDEDFDGPPLKKERLHDEDDDEDDDGKVVLGLGRKRMATPMPPIRMSTSSSTLSSSTGKKKAAAGGTTAKDRIKSLLMKRR
ncbi:JmjC domain-containing histone demethylation protein 1 [Mortierella sp. GBA30]|nr:JmjC domain-containing histone demethylation protein 1 [Mortierella sp. GBA30]